MKTEVFVPFESRPKIGAESIFGADGAITARLIDEVHLQIWIKTYFEQNRRMLTLSWDRGSGNVMQPRSSLRLQQEDENP